MHTVDGAASVVRLMDRVAADVRREYVTNQMEVDRVTTQLELLPTIVKLSVFYSSDHNLFSITVDHDLCAILLDS